MGNAGNHTFNIAHTPIAVDGIRTDFKIEALEAGDEHVVDQENKVERGVQ